MIVLILIIVIIFLLSFGIIREMAFEKEVKELNEDYQEKCRKYEELLKIYRDSTEELRRSLSKRNLIKKNE